MPRSRERPRRELPRRDRPQQEKAREWSVNIPLADLHKLLNNAELMEQMQEDNAQLRRELEGLRNMFSELQTAYGELRRELKGR